MQEKNHQSDSGENAEKPSQIPRRGWGQIAKRTGQQIKTDHVQIVAAGVAFYFFLSLFPAIAAFVSIYGLLFDPAEAQSQIAKLSSVLPQQAQDVIAGIAQHVAGQSNGALSTGVAVSLLLSLWSANKGAKGLFEGLNVAYAEEDERGFFKKTGITLLFTLVAIVLGIFAVLLVAVFPAVVNTLPLPEFVLSTLNVLRWPLAALVVALLIAYAYRVAPDRPSPQWRWLNWGSIVATLLWLVGSALFSLYVSNFETFGGTYGSFAAVIVLMLWFFMSAFVILVGAEINTEIERHTSVDTTVGKSKPMGQRGAHHADHAPPEGGKA